MIKVDRSSMAFMFKVRHIAKIDWGLVGLWLISIAYIVFVPCSELNRLNLELDTQMQKLRVVRQQLKVLPALLDKQQRENLLIEKYQQQLVEAEKLTGALLKVTEQAIDSGLQVKLFQPANQSLEDVYKALFAHIQLVGNYQQLTQFMYAMARNWPLVVLEELTLAVDNNHKQKLMLTGLIRVCQVLDPKVP